LAVAYIVITTEIGGEKEVKDRLSTLPEVKEIHEVLGVYDLIVRMETDKMSELKDTVGQKIRCLDRVRSTLTMIVT
jgi:DNA-binding Lrp family transcriptional regulator